MPKAARSPVFKRPRSKFWQLRWTMKDGREIRRSSNTEDFGEAHKELIRLQAGSGITFRELASRFFEEHQMQPKTAKCYRSSLQVWDFFVGSLRVDQIGISEIQKFVSVRLKQVRHGTIRNDLAFLSSLMSFAMMLPDGPKTNPVAAFSKKQLKLPEARVRWLNPIEVKNLLEAIPTEKFRLIVLFGLEAGLRLKEILNLRVSQVDVENHKIWLKGHQTKSKRGRTVPISSALLRALAHYLPEPNQDWMFINPETRRPYEGVRPWWTNATAKVGLRDFHFHDLRHHFASMYVQRGGRLETLRELLGHASVQMTDRYSHLAEGDAAAEFRRIDAAFNS